MKKAFIVVDYQYDFVADDGKLTVGKRAQLIESKIAEIAARYNEEDIFFTFDNHSESDWHTDIFPETKAFPAHCIRDTIGFQLYGNIKGSLNKSNYLFKHAYCPDFEKLEKIVKLYDEITVAGVVTDICVFQTVIGLYTAAVNTGKKLKITVDSAACASFNQEREAFTLKYMKEVLSVNVL